MHLGFGPDIFLSSSFWPLKKQVLALSPLNNFSDIFFVVEKIAIFVTLKKITYLNFQSDLKKKIP